MREADNIFWYLYCLLGKTNRGPRMHAGISRNFPVLFRPILYIVYKPVLRIRKDLHHFGKLDPDPHQSDADPQYWYNLCILMRGSKRLHSFQLSLC
jgi:hypothetical protein